MNPPDLQHAGPLAINMNQPGSFLHWSIFTVSVANLVRPGHDPAAARPVHPRSARHPAADPGAPPDLAVLVPLRAWSRRRRGGTQACRQDRRGPVELTGFRWLRARRRLLPGGCVRRALLLTTPAGAPSHRAHIRFVRVSRWTRTPARLSHHGGSPMFNVDLSIRDFDGQAVVARAGNLTWPTLPVSRPI